MNTVNLYEKNLEKLYYMQELGCNISIVSYVKELLKSLEVYQSNIFPGADLQYIQLEFYKGQSYLELQIYCDHCELFQTGRELSNDIFKTLDYDKKQILNIIKEFFSSRR
jgi:hypothetical protein